MSVIFSLRQHGSHRKRRVQQFFYCCIVFVAAVTFLPTTSNNRRDTQTDGLRCHDIHTKFNTDWFRHSKVNRGRFTDTDSVEMICAYFRKVGLKNVKSSLYLIN
jgi:hypothetical protein